MFNIGIDLGGTDIKTAIVDMDGNIVAKAQRPTLAQRPYNEVVKDMADSALEALAKTSYTLDDIKNIGIGIPGIADEKTGNVIFCTNLGWYDTPLSKEIQKYINKPVFINNDATVAGYAEYIAVVSKGTHSSVFITLGTGIGSGIIINGKPWSGFHGVGAELGHAPLNVINGVMCTCGNEGCLERYCSATALIRLAKETLQKDNNSIIFEKCKGNLEKINARMVVDAAKENDEIAVKIFDEYVFYLSKAILMVINIIDPEVIVLGGGVSKAGSFLVDAVNKKIPGFLLYKNSKYPEILIAKLGADAGVIGAAMLGKE
ncbi:MAG: ROK family protein [Christensenellaceae bacterium]|nr:ROK family protein [Christensenellaceae bacterium]